MRLIGREKLSRLRGKGVELEKWAHSWVAEVVEAQWRQPGDVAKQFPNVRHQGHGCFLFPVASCDVSIELQIAFPQSIALISDLNMNDVTYGS